MQELVCFATRRVVRYAICWAVVLCQASAQAATDGKSTASGEGMALVLAAQEERVKMIERVLPAVVCVEASVDASGGGSGVLIDADGYGLTNFHVVGKMLGERKGIGGLNDGVPYTLEVLGIDPTGDVAMFRLVGRDEFPFVNLGDSDAVALGDQTVAIGNPFSLATDYKPTATYGIVTGVHRYQWGVGNNLIYSDCIQVDTSINPGNSGGPLFNMAGEVIGINGRISVNTRGRFNVGFGYAISANQIKMFIPTLRAGHVAKHGSMMAFVEREVGRSNGKLQFVNIIPEAASDVAGIKLGDELLRIDDQPIRSPNHFVSLMGTYPADRHVKVTVRREGVLQDIIVKLDPIEPDMSRPYRLDRDVNRREAVRVLKGLHEAQMASRSGPQDEYPAGLRTSVTAERHDEGQDGPGVGVGQFELRFDANDKILRFARTDAASQRIITNSEEGTTEQAAPDAEAFAVDTIEHLTFSGLATVFAAWTDAASNHDYRQITHQGSNRLYRLDHGCALPQCEVLVLDWKTDADTMVRLHINADRGRIEQVVASDEPSGQQVVIDFCEFADTGVAEVPAKVTIQQPGRILRWKMDSWVFDEWRVPEQVERPSEPDSASDLQSVIIGEESE